MTLYPLHADYPEAGNGDYKAVFFDSGQVFYWGPSGSEEFSRLVITPIRGNKEAPYDEQTILIEVKIMRFNMAGMTEVVRDAFGNPVLDTSVLFSFAIQEH